MNLQNLTELAIGSVYGFPTQLSDFFEAGRKSVYIRCRSCGNRPTDKLDVEYMSEVGVCLNCESRS